MAALGQQNYFFFVLSSTGKFYEPQKDVFIRRDQIFVQQFIKVQSNGFNEAKFISEPKKGANVTQGFASQTFMQKEGSIL